jgi:hypothetical protein
MNRVSFCILHGLTLTLAPVPAPAPTPNSAPWEGGRYEAISLHVQRYHCMSEAVLLPLAALTLQLSSVQSLCRTSRPVHQLDCNCVICTFCPIISLPQPGPLRRCVAGWRSPSRVWTEGVRRTEACGSPGDVANNYKHGCAAANSTAARLLANVLQAHHQA